MGCPGKVYAVSAQRGFQRCKPRKQDVRALFIQSLLSSPFEEWIDSLQDVLPCCTAIVRCTEETEMKHTYI